jgi:hypothetical protein
MPTNDRQLVLCPRCGAEFIPTLDADFIVGQRVLYKTSVGWNPATIVKVNHRRLVIRLDGVDRPRPIRRNSPYLQIEKRESDAD